MICERVSELHEGFTTDPGPRREQKQVENKTREECRKTVTSLLFNLYGAPSRTSPEPEPEPELNHNHSQQMLRVI